MLKIEIFIYPSCHKCDTPYAPGGEPMPNPHPFAMNKDFSRVDILQTFLQKDRDAQLEVLSGLVDTFATQHGVHRADVIEILKNNPFVPRLPLCAFRHDLSGLETIVKFLRENVGWDFGRIAATLGRDAKSLSTTYRNAKKKYPGRLDLLDYTYSIPTPIFSDRRFNVLELIVAYLKDHYGLSFKQIAARIHRDYKTVWTVYSKVRKKGGKQW